MSNKLIPGDRVVVDAGLGITKTGNVQRITESTVFVKHYNGAVVGYKTQHVTKMISEQADVKPRGVGLKSEFEAFALVMEKKLTPAELKKREEVAQAMERENPGMDMSKKMAIATATAKKVAEETVEEAKAHTAPKTPKEKSLAALAHPKDKITHADVMVGRGVKKEEAEQIDELSKKTLGSYVKAASDDRAWNSGVSSRSDAAGDDETSMQHHAKSHKRRAGIVKAVDRLAKENVEIQEAMISYSDFQSKLDAHRKAGNKIKDDKYDKKKASYTVIDQEGAAKKITHTDAGVSQQHLGSMKRDDDESSETKSTEKRGRGRPAGSKSGARN